MMFSGSFRHSMTDAPIGPFRKLLLEVFAPFGNSYGAGTIDVVILVAILLELSAPAFLSWVIRIVQPAVRTHQPQERW